jgi:hypothetical protein
VWALSPRTLAELGVDDDHVEVRRVGVSVLIDNFNDLDADDRCYYRGRARGVRKISLGKQGSSSLPP